MKGQTGLWTRALIVFIIFFCVCLGNAKADHYYLFPNGDYSSTWAGNGGTSHWDELQDGTQGSPTTTTLTDYIQSWLNNAYTDRWNLTNCPADDMLIDSVTLYLYVVTSGTSTGITGSAGWTISGTDYSVATMNATGATQRWWLSGTSTVNPATGDDWTKDEVNSLIAYIYTTSNATRRLSVYSVYVDVNYTPRYVESVGVLPAAAELEIGELVQYNLTAYYSDETTEDHTNEAVWTSTDDDVVTVDNTGRVSAHSEGEAQITGAYSGFEDTQDVTVVTNYTSGGIGEPVVYYNDWDGVTYDTQEELDEHSQVALPGGQSVTMSRRQVVAMSGMFGVVMGGIIFAAFAKSVL